MTMSFWGKKNESGRTMAELLAVLAILAVLTIGGILGYRYAMQYYRENETLNDISVTAAGSRTWDILQHYGDRAVDAPFIIPIREVVSNVRYYSDSTASDEDVEDQQLKARELESFTTAVHAPVWVRIEHPGAFTIRVSGLSKSLCQKLMWADLGNTYTYKQPERNDLSRDFERADTYLAASLRNSPDAIEALCSSIDPLNSRIPPVQQQVSNVLAQGSSLPAVQTLDQDNNTLVLYFGIPDDCAMVTGLCGDSCYVAHDDGSCSLASPGRYGCPCDSSNPPADSCLFCDNGVIAIKNTSSCDDYRLNPCSSNAQECIEGKPYRKDNQKFSPACCEALGGFAATDAICCIGDKEWNGNSNIACESGPISQCLPHNPYDPVKYPAVKELSPQCCTQAGGKFMSKAGQSDRNVGQCCQRSSYIVQEDVNSHTFTRKSQNLSPGDNIFGLNAGSDCCVTKKVNGVFQVQPYMLNNSSKIDESCCNAIPNHKFVSSSLNGSSLSACCDLSNPGLDFNGDKRQICGEADCNPGDECAVEKCCKKEGGVPTTVEGSFKCCAPGGDGTLFSNKNVSCISGGGNQDKDCCTSSHKSDFCCTAIGGVFINSSGSNACCHPSLDGRLAEAAGNSTQCCDTSIQYAPDHFCCPVGLDPSRCITPSSDDMDCIKCGGTPRNGVCCRSGTDGCAYTDNTCKNINPSPTLTCCEDAVKVVGTCSK